MGPLVVWPYFLPTDLAIRRGNLRVLMPARLCAAIDDSSMINEAMKLILVPGISTLKFPRLTSMQAKSVGKLGKASCNTHTQDVRWNKLH